jgi:uncharacterized membrane protein YgcG
MQLELLVDREELREHERALIDALFESGETTTDTKRVRERYAKTGFDPASKIKQRLSELVAGLAADRAPGTPSAWPTVLLFVVGVALTTTGMVGRPDDALVVIAGLGICAAWYILTIGLAVTWRSRVYNVATASLGFIIPIALLAGGLFYILATGVSMAGLVTLTGVTMFALACITSVLNQARSRQGVERIALRRRLALARRYFQDQLAQRQPALEDAWFPYLIAFGLGKHMDRWFRAFGPAHAMAASQATSQHWSSSGSSGTGHSGGGWTGFGGGGGFAGGGASASWVAAAGTMAAGVSAPSSSSSGGGGGGGGGGSSGGGGGGGW